LRREGIYSPQLATWRRQREASERVALEPRKLGRKADPGIAEARRVPALTKDNERLRPASWRKSIPSSMSKKTLYLTRPADGRGPGRELLMSALNVLSPDIGLAPACAALRINRAGIYRDNVPRRRLFSPLRQPQPRPRAHSP
jgi:hypothetical protein